MNVVLMTTAANQFGGALIAAYREAGGPRFSTALFVPDRSDVGFPGWSNAYVAAKLLGAQGAMAHLRPRLPMPLPRRWRGLGLERSWRDAVTDYCDTVVGAAAPNSPEGLASLAAAAPDILVSIGVPYVLSRRVLEIPRLALNVHNGLLPKYRGHFATFWEVLEREPRYGVTVHRMAAKVDAGAIVAQETLGWEEASSFADLLIRKKRIGGALLARAVRDAFDSTATAPDKPATPHYGFPKIADLRRWSWKNRAPNR